MAEAKDGWKRIVVGVELGAGARTLSPGSEAALLQAELLAKHFGSTITVLHSSADDEVLDDVRGEYVRRLELGGAGRASLEAATERLQSLRHLGR